MPAVSPSILVARNHQLRRDNASPDPVPFLAYLRVHAAVLHVLLILLTLKSIRKRAACSDASRGKGLVA